MCPISPFCLERKDNSTMEILSKRALGCMYVATGIGSLILLAIVATVNCVLFIPEHIRIGKLISLIVVILILFNAVVSPYFRFHRYRYKINEECIDIREGYLFVERNIVPIERLHKMQVSRGPIDRIFGVAKVQVTTAGGDVTIRFLEKERADVIAEGLMKRVNRIAVEQREEHGE